MCVHIYIYIYTYIYIYIHTYIHTYTHIFRERDIMDSAMCYQTLMSVFLLCFSLASRRGQDKRLLLTQISQSLFMCPQLP